MKEIMNKAWEIANKAAARHGGKAIEYIAGSLEWAWALAKEDEMLDEKARVKKEMRKLQDEVKGLWKKIEESVERKFVQHNVQDEKEQFKLMNHVKLQWLNFINWAPEYADYDKVVDGHKNILNFIK